MFDALRVRAAQGVPACMREPRHWGAVATWLGKRWLLTGAAHLRAHSSTCWRPKPAPLLPTCRPVHTTDVRSSSLLTLQSGEVQAIVLDSYVLEYEAGLNCDLVTVGNDWKQASAVGPGLAALWAGTPERALCCTALFCGWPYTGRPAGDGFAPLLPCPQYDQAIAFRRGRTQRWSAPSTARWWFYKRWVSHQLAPGGTADLRVSAGCPPRPCACEQVKSRRCRRSTSLRRRAARRQGSRRARARCHLQT